jgi:hypothetical protein
MARKKDPTAADEYLVRRSITQAMKHDLEGGNLPLVVDSRQRAMTIARARTAPTISLKENLLRIVEEADPLGFLISVQRGDLQPVTHVNPQGELEVRYVQPDLPLRVGVAEFLAHKILPTISLKMQNPFQDAGDAEKEGPVRPGQPGAPTFSEMVSRAAVRARAQAAAGKEMTGPTFEPVKDEGPTYGQSDDEADAGE